jgi:hypothetical protein
LIGLLAITVAACAHLGILLGWALPAVVAIPLGAVVTFWWFAYTTAYEVPLLHNMNATFAACCSSNAQPVPGAVLAGSCLALVVCVGTVALMKDCTWAGRPRAWVVAGTALVVAAAGGVGSLVAVTAVDRLTLAAIEPRTSTVTCTEVRSVQLCLWPEERGRAALVARLAEELEVPLLRWGLPGIARVDSDPRSRDAVAVRAGRALTDDQIRYSLAAGYVDDFLDCPGSTGPARDERVAALLLAQNVDDLAQVLAPEVIERAQARLRAAPAAVGSWFRSGAETASCPRPR